MDNEDMYGFCDDGLEHPEGYTPGGYHPTLIGDVFNNGRYRVVHKLGHGSQSTIWLVQDLQDGSYAALKIQSAFNFSDSHEVDILRRLTEDGSSHAGKQFIPLLRDAFTIDGVNGKHLCLVQRPAGFNAADSKDRSCYDPFTPETARSVAAQLILGLTYLHSQDICHGDLHPRNILLDLSSLDGFGRQELLQRFPVEEHPLKRDDGAPLGPHVPPHQVHPMDLCVPADEVVDPVITICDFGTSFVHPSECPAKLYTPALYLAPEGVFEEPATLAADIWTLGVTLYELLGSRILFESYFGATDEVLCEAVSALGLPPARWWEKWEARSKYFEPDGSWKSTSRSSTPVSRTLYERMWITRRGDTPETCAWDYEGGELHDLVDMLSSMLTWEPRDRPTAEELAKCKYMTKWALPAWHRQLARQKNASASVNPSVGCFQSDAEAPAASKDVRQGWGSWMPSCTTH